jgi:putative endonuclease
VEARSKRLKALASGEDGEAVAARYLEDRGGRILARRFRVRGGEVDLVAEIDGLVAFVEVKTRSAGAMDDGRSAVTSAKRQRLTRAAGLYLARYGLDRRPCRFDVISVVVSAEGTEIRHFPGAFEAG